VYKDAIMLLEFPPTLKLRI